MVKCKIVDLVTWVRFPPAALIKTLASLIRGGKIEKMPRITLYKNYGRGNKRVLEEIAREVFEKNFREKYGVLPVVTALFTKRSDSKDLDIFDLDLEIEKLCMGYVVEVEKLKSGLYIDSYKIFKRENYDL